MSAQVSEKASLNPVWIRASADVREAAQRMRDERVGCLIVVEERDQIVGVVTDRDLTLRVVADGNSRLDASVHSVMSSPAVVIDAETTLEEAQEVMRTRGIRRLPVVANQRLVGILTLDDAVQEIAIGLAQLGRLRAQRGPVPDPLH